MNHAVVSLGIVNSILILAAAALLITDSDLWGGICMSFGLFGMLALLSMIFSTGVGSRPRT